MLFRNYLNQFGWPLKKEAYLLKKLGFYDSSWKNDMCPSFTNSKLGIRVWVDHPKKHRRELENAKKFTVVFWNCETDEPETEPVLETESVYRLVSFIAIRLRNSL